MALRMQNTIFLNVEGILISESRFFNHQGLYNAHIRYAGSFRQYPTSEGHIIKVKVEYQGYISQKMAVSGALVFQTVWPLCRVICSIKNTDFHYNSRHLSQSIASNFPFFISFLASSISSLFLCPLLRTRRN